MDEIETTCDLPDNEDTPIIMNSKGKALDNEEEDEDTERGNKILCKRKKTPKTNAATPPPLNGGFSRPFLVKMVAES